MHRRVRSLRAAAAIAGFIVVLTIGSAAAAGAQRQTEDVTGDQFTCGATVYTIQSGTISLVLHEGSTPSGNFNFTGTITPDHVVATDQSGNVVKIVGADWFGGAGNATGEVFTETDKFQIIGATGGVLGSVNETSHVNTRNGLSFDFNFGECSAPED